MVSFPYIVIPKTGFGFARFGEDRSKHRSELGEFESWQRNPQVDRLTDLYLESLMSLDYDDEDKLDFIEIVNDEAIVYVEGVQFVNRPFDQVVADLASRGHDVVGPHVGVYAYPELGVRFGRKYDSASGVYLVDGVSLLPEETDPALLAPYPLAP